MPTDVAAQQDSDRDRDMGEETDEFDPNERGGSKQKSSAKSAIQFCFSSQQISLQLIPYLLAKDLSHVPCKFFKVGGCTAGASCPFSHVILEPGQQKEVCTWFVKGNCKFGHKCALAHILPGQSMAMDRKNKKAAQTAASSSEKGKSGKGGKKDVVGSGGNKVSLLTGGSTAPTRILSSPSSGSSKPARAPINMPLKATISPSAPAPALQDADFASFATLDELEDLQQNSLASQDVDKTILRDSTKETDTSAGLSKQFRDSDGFAEPIPLPPSAPRPSAIAIVNDYGPIGSPPNFRAGQATSPIPANGTGFSPAISPRNHSSIVNHGTSFLSNAPLSAPGTQEHFVSSSFSMRGGMAASLGSGIAMLGGRRGLEDYGPGMPSSFSGLLGSQLSSSTSQNFGLNGLSNVRGEYDNNIDINQFSGATRQGMDSAVEDEEMGDFLPSSLNDLLTPEEKSRRVLRSNGPKPSGISHLSSALANVRPDLPVPADTNGFRDETATAGNVNGNSTFGHKHSRSVPAYNLLGEIKSIWTDTTTNPIPSSPHHGVPSGAFATVVGSGNSHADEIGLGISSAGATPSSLGMIGPSNASAAFLPSLHKHYMDAKTKQVQQSQLGHASVNRGPRGASNPLLSNSLANNYTHPLGGVGSAANPSGLHAQMHGNTTTPYWASPSPFDLTKAHQSQSQAARHIPPNLSSQPSKLDDPLTAPTLLSPSSRALQSHAPGQSLPQGLAAGYSRIHALPPLPSITSPQSGSFVAGSSPAGKTFSSNTEGLLGEWMAATNTSQGVSGSVHSNTGIDSVISRFPYSPAATRNGSGGPPAGHSGAPPGLARINSGGRYIQPLSPLNRPIMTRDDDILFEMDK